MPPKLQYKLNREILKAEKKFFYHLFHNVINENITYSVPETIVYAILGCIESEFYLQGEPVRKANDKFNYFYMVKNGSIKCFDENYEYMYDLKEGSFIGEYHIMFGLYSNMYYQPVLNSNSTDKYITLFKI